MNDLMLKVRNLKVIFPNQMGVLKAVEGINFDIPKGKCVAIVGESGCGKSVTSLAVMKLLNSPPAMVRVDELVLDGVDLKDYTDQMMQEVRGKQISMIFQDAMTALNPVMTIGKQIDEVFIRHGKMDKGEARIATIKALELVGVPEPKSRAHQFPHQLSGGMRQRVLIAMAFACMPKLIIADEPTTALDVTIQSQILNLMIDLKNKLDTAIILITHDLGVVAQLAENIMVMYAGKAVEYADSKSLFRNPLHPYTVGLLHSIPRIDQELEKLFIIRGTVPSPLKLPAGCKFCTRCDDAREICFKEEPEYINVDEYRKVRCWKYAGVGYYE